MKADFYLKTIQILYLLGNERIQIGFILKGQAACKYSYDLNPNECVYTKNVNTVNTYTSVIIQAFFPPVLTLL